MRTVATGKRKGKERDLDERLRAALKNASRIASLAVTMESELSDIVETRRMEGANPVALKRVSTKMVNQALANVAGLTSIEIITRHDDRKSVSMDHRPAFVLPPLLGDTLSILARASDETHDEFVTNWTSVETIAASLEKIYGRRFSRKNVIQKIYLLKQRLAANHENLELIRHNPRLGYRFLLRRSPSVA